MYKIQFTNGSEFELTVESYRTFQQAIGNGPRFVELILKDGTLILANKDQIVCIVEVK